MSDTIAEPLAPEILESFDRLRADCGLLDLSASDSPCNVSIIEVRGEDRKGWLQGQATNDLKQLDIGASSAFCLCSPTGQILAICDIWGLPDRFLVTCDTSTAAAFMDRVEQMVIMEDVEAKNVTEDFTLLSIQGPNASRALQSIVTLPTLDAADSRAGDQELVALRSNRTGLGGWDILVPRAATKTAKAVSKSFTRILPEAYEIARIEAGIPAAGRDWDSKTLPPELGPAFEARHISYRKGCYTGQEVLMRIHSRGHTNRTWMVLHSEAPLNPGDLVSHPRRKDAGHVTSACYSPDYGYIAGAMLRNEAAQERDQVTVETKSGSVETVEPIAVTVPYGQAVSPEQLKKALADHPDAKAVFATLSETSTGVANDIESFGKIVAPTPALLIVDTISGLGVMPCETDAWHIDINVTGSQKALMLPPGLAFVSVSDKAWKVIESNTQRRVFYFDLLKYRDKIVNESDTPYTPAHTLIKALRLSLKQIRAEGIENVWKRHARVAAAARAGIKGMGLDLLAERPADGLTVAKMPAGVDSSQVLSKLEKQYGLKLANGQDTLKGKVVRLAHMGYIDQFEVLAGIAGLELVLSEMGAAVKPGSGVAAMQQCLASAR